MPNEQQWDARYERLNERLDAMTAAVGSLTTAVVQLRQWLQHGWAGESRSLMDPDGRYKRPLVVPNQTAATVTVDGSS